MIFSANESESFCKVACPGLGGWGSYKLVLDLEQRIIVVACLDLGGWGCYKLVSEPMVSILNLDGPCMRN
jgi:hypothetical protein